MELKLPNGTHFFATILQHCSEFPLALDKKEEGFLKDLLSLGAGIEEEVRVHDRHLSVPLIQTFLVLTGCRHLSLSLFPCMQNGCNNHTDIMGLFEGLYKTMYAWQTPQSLAYKKPLSAF